MTCDNCKLNNASICWKQSFNNEIIELNLCKSCADKLNIDFTLSNIFKDFFKEIEKINFFNKLNKEIESKKCKECGNNIEKMNKNGKIGCYNCYETFKEELRPVITKIHPNSIHIGKIPQKANTKVKLKRDINSLKEKLKQAINTENYELAAEIRDKIREIERGEI